MQMTTVDGRSYYGNRTHKTAAARAERRRQRLAKYGKRGTGRKSWLNSCPSSRNGKS